MGDTHHGLVRPPLPAKIGVQLALPPLTPIPQCEGKHASELVDAVLPPLSVGMGNHLGVEAGCECFDPALFAQLLVIVDFTVVGDTIPPPPRPAPRMGC